MCRFHWEWTRRGEREQSIPATPTSLPPTRGLILQPQAHTPRAQGTALHQAVRKTPAPAAAPSKPQVPSPSRARPQTHARRLTAGKGFPDHQAQPLHFPEEKAGPGGGLRGRAGSATASAGLRLCPAPVPLPEATSAAAPRLPSCSPSLVPAPANSPLGWPPLTLWQEKMARAGSLPLYVPPLISSQLLLPSRDQTAATPNNGSAPSCG